MKATADKEFSAMRRITEILYDLEEDQAGRVLEYVTARARSPKKPTQLVAVAAPTKLEAPAQPAFL